MQITLFFTYGVGLNTWVTRGIFSREVNYYKKLAQSGVDRIVFITYDPMDLKYSNELQKDNICICVRPKWMPKILFSLFSPLLFWREISKSDILKTNQMSGSWSGVIAKIFFRKPLIVRTGYTLSDFQQRLHRPFYKVLAVVIEYISTFFADVIFVSSTEQVSYLPKRVYKKTKVIPNYIDTDLFTPNKIDNKREVYSIISVGRLSSQKNVYFLIDVVSHLSNIKLVLVGDGELKNEIKEYAQKLGVEVEFSGIIANSELPKIICTSNLFVSTSKFEGNPKTILEAMACGMPVVAGLASGIKDIISNNETGLLCDFSIDSFVKNISYLIDNPVVSNKLGLAARQWVINNQSLNCIIEKELQCYNDLN